MTRPVRAATFAVCLALAALAVAPTARADENAEARILFDQGNRQLGEAMRQRGPRRRSGLEQALESYIGSVRIVRSRNAVFNCGAVLQELGRLDEAYDYYREYVSMPDVGEQDRADAQARIAAITPQLALIEVNSTPAGAEVRVDRRDLAPRGRTPLAFAVPAGDHVLHLDAPGYQHAEARVTTHTGETTRLVRQLDAAPIAVHVLAPAGATVTIDGHPGESAELAPGVHSARAELAGYPPLERRFELVAGAPAMTITLDTQASGVVEGRGRLVVETNAHGRVIVDGRPVETGRGATLALGAGQHALRVEGDGHLPYEGMFDVQDGRTTHAHIALGRDPVTLRHMGAWPWLSLVVTGIIGAVYVGATVIAFQDHSAYDTAYHNYQGTHLSADLSILDTKTQALQRSASGADIAFVFTLVFAGLTTLLFFLEEGAGPPTHGDFQVEADAPAAPTARATTTGGMQW